MIKKSIKRWLTQAILITTLLFLYLLTINLPVLHTVVEVLSLKTASLYKNSDIINNHMESAPFDLDGLHYLVSEHDKGFRFYDATHHKIAFYPTSASLASSLVVGSELLVAATRYNANTSESALILFRFNHGISSKPSQSTILSSTRTKFFNTTLAYDYTRKVFVLAYELDEPGLIPFSVRFLTSKDLKTWVFVNETFHPDKYAACPTVRVIDGVYYLWYLEKLKHSRVFLTKIARSVDLKYWQVSPITFLSPLGTEGINASDFDYVNIKGKSYIFYAIGDQLTNGSAQIKLATIDFELDKIVAAFFDNDPEQSLERLGVKTHHSLDLLPLLAKSELLKKVKFIPSKKQVE